MSYTANSKLNATVAEATQCDLVCGDTGEILSDNPILVGRDVSKQDLKFAFNRWLAFGRGSGRKINSAPITLFDKALAHELFDYVDFGNDLVFGHTRLAKVVGVHRTQITRSVTRMVKAGILQREFCDKKGVHYKLNPSIAWIGHAAHHRRAIEEYERKRAKIGEIDDVRECRISRTGGAADREPRRKRDSAPEISLEPSASLSPGGEAAALAQGARRGAHSAASAASSASSESGRIQSRKALGSRNAPKKASRPTPGVDIELGLPGIYVHEAIGMMISRGHISAMES